jgi:hypothetical protein
LAARPGFKASTNSLGSLFSARIPASQRDPHIFGSCRDFAIRLYFVTVPRASDPLTI